jgi:ribosomal protein S18 acetylase RimI-like enzyme
MEIRIRQAEPDDLHELARLFDAYRQFYDQPSDVRGAREFLRERMDNRQSLVIVAESEDSLVGFTQLYPMFSSVRLAPIWILNDLYVDADMRRLGIGRLLLEASAAAARGAGASRIVLETARENLAARALYEAADWDEESTQWYSLDLTASSQVN